MEIIFGHTDKPRYNETHRRCHILALYRIEVGFKYTVTENEILWH
jgi:hypothetical protein